MILLHSKKDVINCKGAIHRIDIVGSKELNRRIERAKKVKKYFETNGCILWAGKLITRELDLYNLIAKCIGEKHAKKVFNVTTD